MLTYIVERTIPPAFTDQDPETVGRHARWAVDAYKKVGAFWLGGAVTEDRMYSLVTAETGEDLVQYGRALGIGSADKIVRRIIRPLGPYFANPSQ